MKSKNYFSNLSQKQLNNMLISSASMSGDCLFELLENGANPNAYSSFGWTPLMFAAYRGDLQTLKTLINFGANVNPRIYNVNIIACNSNNTEVIRFLLENGANVNERGFYGSTPLIAGVKTGNVEIVKLFLDYNADVNACDHLGNTALYYAIELKHKDIEKLLREKDGNLTSSDSSFTSEYDKIFEDIVKGTSAEKSDKKEEK